MFWIFKFFKNASSIMYNRENNLGVSHLNSHQTCWSYSETCIFTILGYSLYNINQFFQGFSPFFMNSFRSPNIKRKELIGLRSPLPTVTNETSFNCTNETNSFHFIDTHLASPSSDWHLRWFLLGLSVLTFVLLCWKDHKFQITKQ